MKTYLSICLAIFRQLNSGLVDYFSLCKGFAKATKYGTKSHQGILTRAFPLCPFVPYFVVFVVIFFLIPYAILSIARMNFPTGIIYWYDCDQSENIQKKRPKTNVQH